MSADIVRIAKRLVKRFVGQPLYGRSILMYHRVAKTNFDPWNIAVSPDEFERHLTNLRNKAVLPLREFVELHRSKRLPRNAMAITFDDGYACNALVAAPILESFGYPATFFVVSKVIERPEEFWWDQLESIFHSPKFEYDVATSLMSLYTTKALGEVDREIAPLAAFIELWRVLRELSTEQRYQYLDELRRHLGLENMIRPTHRPMTELELRTLGANPLFEVGAHTATHPCLPMLAPVEQRQEIILGAQFLERTLGNPIRSFAYPFGEFGPNTRDIVMASGFECAVTVEHRSVRWNDDQFKLPRRQMVNSYVRTP